MPKAGSHTLGGSFTNVAGPFWVRRVGEGVDVEVGLIIEPRHCNEHMGFLHGGAVMTFADVALGAPCLRALGGMNAVTMQLNTHFVAPARVGEFLYCKAELVRRTKRLMFVRGLIMVDDRVVASCDGVWSIVNPKALKPRLA